MSHWFKLKTTLNSKSAIINAANRMGYLVQNNSICRGWGGNQTQCDLVMKLPGQYDLGFQKQSDGSYEIVADFWQDYISRYLAEPAVLKKAEMLQSNGLGDGAENYLSSAKISKFMQTYNLCAVEELVQRQGLQYVQTVQDNGTIVLEVVGQGV